MFFLFLLQFSLSFQLKGSWNVSLECYKPKQNQNFRIRFSLQNTTFVGLIRTKEPHKMIPKKIHIKELSPDERYVLILPFSENPRFAEFFFKNESNVLKSSVNSSSNEWRVTATVYPSERMELYLEKYGKNMWYKFTATPIPKSTTNMRLYIVLPIIIIVLIAFLMKFTHKENNSQTKEKKD